MTPEFKVKIKGLKFLVIAFSFALCALRFAPLSFGQEAKEEEDLSVAAFAQYSLGWSFYDEEKFSQAKDAFMEFRQKFPRHRLREDTDFKIALCFYNLKDYSRAKENFDAYIKDYPLSKALNEALFYRAECLYYLGELNPAEKDYLRVTADTGEPKLLELAQAGLGWVYIKFKKYPEAEDAFNKITSVNNRAYVSVLLGKAEIAKQKQNYKSALELYDKFIEDFPNDESISAAYLGKAESLSHLLRYEEAVSVYNNILAYSVNKTFPAGFTDKVYYELAQAYLKMGNFTQAILEFDKVAEQSIEPAIKINAICQIGDIYQDLGEFNKAIDNYEKILKDFSDNVYKDYAQYQLSLCLIKTAKFDEAISALKKLETDFPESKIKDEVGYYIGLAYFQKQDFVSAIEELNKFISLFAQSPLRREGIYLKGASLFNLKSYQEAEDVFREAIKESGQDLNFVAKCEFEIAHCLYQNKEKDDAIKKCQEIISRYPNSAIAPDVIYFLGEHYLNTAKEEVAVRYFLRLVSDYRESNLLPNTYYSLGLVYLGQDKYDEALTQFNNLLNSPNNEFKARAVLAIGDVYFKKGDLESALRQYRQALNKASPDKAAEIQFKIAQTLQENGRVDEATEEYFKTSYLYPQDKYWLLKSYLRLARIFEARENWPEAERIYSKVADMEVEEAKFARERLDWIKNLERGK